MTVERHAHLHHRLRGRDRRGVPRRAARGGGGARGEAGVERVIDVRALPLSRRPGFSKSPLRAALEQAGIEYVHLKALGTPAEGRSAARAGRHADLERIYAGQLELPEAIVQGERMLELAAE